MLVQVSLNDSQVPYWEGAKFVAKLRAMKTDTNPLLLKTNMGAGHGGASGRYDALRETAFTYAFMLWQMGVPVAGDRHVVGRTLTACVSPRPACALGGEELLQEFS